MAKKKTNFWDSVPKASVPPKEEPTEAQRFEWLVNDLMRKQVEHRTKLEAWRANFGSSNTGFSFNHDLYWMDDIFEVAAKAEVTERILLVISKNLFSDAPINTVDQVTKYVQEEALRRARSSTSSTSATANRATAAGISAWADFASNSWY